MSIHRTVSRLGRALLYLPKTIYINFRCLPAKQAMKLPIVLMGKTKTVGLKRNMIQINASPRFAMINFGSQNTSKKGILTGNNTTIYIENGGRIIFNGEASIGRGSSLCASGGTMTIGNKFSCNSNCFLYCQNRISIGEDVLLGWNINIRDNDGHPLYNNEGVEINPPKPIQLGNHVWIGSYVDILKGVTIQNGTIIATRSLVTKDNLEPNVIIAGSPARIIKREIYWNHNSSSVELRKD